MSNTEPESLGEHQDENTPDKMLRYRARREIRRHIALKIAKPIMGIGGCFVGFFVLYLLVDLIRRVFLQAAEPAHQITCLSNVKQLGLGMLMYEEDWDNRMPIAAHWIDATMPYVKNESIYRCPAVTQEHPDGYGYAFNSDLSLLQTEKIKDPAKTPLLYDSALLYRNAGAPGLQGLLPAPRHHEGNTVGYADGHAKAVPVDHTP